jgi:hypothetical protein
MIRSLKPLMSSCCRNFTFNSGSIIKIFGTMRFFLALLLSASVAYAHLVGHQSLKHFNGYDQNRTRAFFCEYPLMFNFAEGPMYVGIIIWDSFPMGQKSACHVARSLQVKERSLAAVLKVCGKQKGRGPFVKGFSLV